MRFSHNIEVYDIKGDILGNLPTPWWNFLYKENTYIHLLFIDLILLKYISKDLIKNLIYTDIIYESQKLLNQLIGLIFAKHPPTWCNQRMTGYLLSLGIVGFLTYYNRRMISNVVTKFINIYKICVVKWLDRI